MPKLKIIIVGAGPAGTTAAITLSNAGHDVLLLEKNARPGNKTCGGGLGPRSLRILNEIKLLAPEIPQPVFLDIESVGFRTRKSIYHNIRFSDYKSGLKGITCHRSDFDNYLLDVAIKTGTEYQGNTQVVDIKESDDKVVAITKTDRYEGDLLLGADGAHSIFRKHLKWGKNQKTTFAIREIIKLPKEIQFAPNVDFHYSDAFWPGYFWAFPLPGNMLDLGLGIPAKRSDLFPKIKELYKNHINSDSNLLELKTKSEPVLPLRGEWIPVGGKKRKISSKRTLLLGDAAFLVDPLMYEGIANAMFSGQNAGRFIIAKAEMNQLPKHGEWDKLIYSKLMPEFRKNHMINVAIHNKWAFDRMEHFFSKRHKRKSDIIDMIDDKKSRLQIFNPFFYFKH